MNEHHDRLIYGTNGEPGLKTHVASLLEFRGRVRWGLIGLWTLASSVVAGVLILVITKVINI